MSVHVYRVNHVAIEVDDIEKAKAFYQDVFNLELYSGGEGAAFFKVGEHQFLAMSEVERLSPPDGRHFGFDRPRRSRVGGGSRESHNTGEEGQVEKVETIASSTRFMITHFSFVVSSYPPSSCASHGLRPTVKGFTTAFPGW